MKPTLNHPPLPPLEWDKYFWAGKITLDAWEGFQARDGAYASISSDDVSTGEITLIVDTEDKNASSLNQAQIAAFEYLIENQNAIRDAILQDIFTSYPDLQTSYGYESEEAELYMPDIANPQELKPLIGLSSVHIFAKAIKDGIAYVGYEFGCTWDDEHGLGAMVHASRVVETGGADTAILEWIAVRDLESDSE